MSVDWADGAVERVGRMGEMARVEDECCRAIYMNGVQSRETMQSPSGPDRPRQTEVSAQRVSSCK